MFLNKSVLNTLNIFTDLKGKKNIICTMDDVRGDFLGPPQGTTPAAVITNKIKSLDPLASVKLFKDRWYGLYCAISGNGSRSPGSLITWQVYGSCASFKTV